LGAVCCLHGDIGGGVCWPTGLNRVPGNLTPVPPCRQITWQSMLEGRLGADSDSSPSTASSRPPGPLTIRCRPRCSRPSLRRNHPGSARIGSACLFLSSIRPRGAVFSRNNGFGTLYASIAIVERALTNVLRRKVLPSVPVIMVGARLLPSTPNAVGEQADRDSS
jgi:hypothetical protein